MKHLFRTCIVLAIAALAGCGGSKKTSVQCNGVDCVEGDVCNYSLVCTTPVSHAYKGHESTGDITNFVTAYPKAVGTRLDDCRTCHKGGSFTDVSDPSKPSTVSLTACSYCHLVQYPSQTYTGAPLPATYADTLNPYGVAYKNAGRTSKALLDIDGQDSDGDTFANGVEIAAVKFPGDASSKPGQPNATLKTLTMAQIQAMPAHSQFMLANSKSQQYDTYATYTGVKVKDLLTAVGIDPTDPKITGITFIALDGFPKDSSPTSINQQYPNGYFYANLDASHMPPNCGVAYYPSTIPANAIDRGQIPDEQWLMLAYQQDGIPLPTSNLSPVTGEISGDGPFRSVVPNDPTKGTPPNANPGSPDRGNAVKLKCNDGFDYDSSKDHNASNMVRGVVAMRINPLPPGVEDFDWQNSWTYIDSSSIVVYGYGIQK